MAGVKTPKKRGPKRSTETAFLALVPKLEKALREKRKIVELYDEYGAALDVSYSQFARYIERHITKKENRPVGGKARTGTSTPVASATDTPSAPAPAMPARAGPISTPAQTQKKFDFDPTRAYRPGRDKELF